jgi:HEPN domain-containing protein
MSVNDPQAFVQWGEALSWLAKAAADTRGARMLLAGGEADLAAFLAQQALEKTLKALLVAAAQDVLRIHDIDRLATLARIHWPDLLPSPFPLAAVNHWYITTRYPGFDTPSPTTAEVSAALGQVDALIGAVLLRAPPELRAGRTPTG